MLRKCTPSCKEKEQCVKDSDEVSQTEGTDGMVEPEQKVHLQVSWLISILWFGCSGAVLRQVLCSVTARQTGPRLRKTIPNASSALALSTSAAIGCSLLISWGLFPSSLSPPVRLVKAKRSVTAGLSAVCRCERQIYGTTKHTCISL